MKRTILAILTVAMAASAYAGTQFRRHRENALTVLKPHAAGDVVFIGNSITNMHEWREAFGMANVHNRGVSGGTTSEVLANLESYIAGNPSKVFLMIGTNDLGSHTAGNIKKIVRRIHAELPSANIYVQSILPSANGSRTAATITAINSEVQAFVTSLASDKVEYVDLFTQLKNADGSNLNTGYHCGDNLHPSPQGYAVWCDYIKEKVGAASTNYTLPTVAQNTVGSGSAGSRKGMFANWPSAAEDIFFIGTEMVHGGEWAELTGMPNLKNRGSGWNDSTNGDVSIDDLVASLPYIFPEGKTRPGKILVYGGEKELCSMEADAALAKMKTLVAGIRDKAPDATIYMVGLAPVGSTIQSAKGNAAANNTSLLKPYNQKLQAYAAESTDDKIEYIDWGFDDMLLTNGAASTDYIMGGNRLSGRAYAKLATAIVSAVGSGTAVSVEEATARLTLNAKRNEVGLWLDGMLAVEFGTATGTFAESYKAEFNTKLEAVLTALRNNSGVDSLNTAKTTLQTYYATMQANGPQASTEGNEHWYTFSTPLRDTRYMTAGYTGDNVTGRDYLQHKRNMWKFVSRGEGQGYDIINRETGAYLSPNSGHNTAINTAAEQPSAGWTWEAANTQGYFIIKSGTVQLNQTEAGLGYKVYNWGGGSNKGDNGCQFLITEVADEPLPDNGAPTGATIANGWYTMEWVSNNDGDQYKGCFLFNAAEEKLHGGNYYAIGSQTAVANPSYNDPAYYIYVERSGNQIRVRSANGHWLAANATTTETPANINISKWDATQHAMHIGSNWVQFSPSGTTDNYLGLSSGAGTGNANANTLIRLNLLDIPTAGFAAYTVNVVNDPTTASGNASVAANSKAKVTTTSTHVKGLKTVYNGGCFFVERGHTLAVGDISAPAIAGVTPTVEISGTTINVIYTSIEEARAQAQALLDTHGVGYPAVGSDAYNALSAAINATDATSASVLAAMPAYKNATTGIQLPEDGKAYTFTTKQTNGKAYYLKLGANDTELKLVERTGTDPLPDDAKFVCHAVGGKFMFATHTGKYFVSRGHNSGYNSNKGYTDTYAATWCDLTIARITKGSYTGSATSEADFFGCCYVSGKRANGTADGTLVVSDNGEWNYAGSPFYQSSVSSAFRIEEVPYYNKVETREAAGKRWGSIYLPFATTVPAGVTLYKGTANTAEDRVDLVEMEGVVLPANTAAVIVAGSGDSVVFVPSTTAGQPVEGNGLKGTMAENQPVTAGKQLSVLNGVDGKPGFYRYSGSTPPVARAYMEVSPTQAAKGMPLNLGVPTGVSSPRAAMDSSDVYDLQGRRVAAPARGLYIVGGKKVVVK